MLLYGFVLREQLLVLNFEKIFRAVGLFAVDVVVQLQHNSQAGSAHKIIPPLPTTHPYCNLFMNFKYCLNTAGN